MTRIGLYLIIFGLIAGSLYHPCLNISDCLRQQISREPVDRKIRYKQRLLTGKEALTVVKKFTGIQ